MKKWYGALCALALFMLSSMTVLAADKTVVALGADLTAAQRQTVLEYMGLTETDLKDCIVITITNDMEHTYLDAYMNPAVIGTKSLSSVKLQPSGSGSGVLVDTYNINYCTTGMYRNALLTAGLEDTKVTVVAPTPISGTAALIGAVKGYEAMTNEDISDTVLDTAMDELITTGEIATEEGGSDEIEQLIAYVKGKLASGELATEEDIRKAIEEGEKIVGIDLSDADVQKIIDIMNKIAELDLDVDSLVSQAQDLYDRFGKDFLENPSATVSQAVTQIAEQQVQGFWESLKQKIMDTVKGWFSW